MLALASSLALSSFAQQLNDRANAWVQHTLIVKEQAQRLLAFVIDSGAAAREYALLPDAGFLKSQRESSSAVPPVLERLDVLVDDNPVQDNRVHNQLVPVIYRQLDLEKKMIDEGTRGRDRAALRPLFEASEEEMGHLRSLLSTIIHEEDELLDARQRAGKEQIVEGLRAGAEARLQTGVRILKLQSSLSARITELEALQLENQELKLRIPL